MRDGSGRSVQDPAAGGPGPRPVSAGLPHRPQRGGAAAVEVVQFVGERIEDVRVSATVDLASIHTGNADRDAHARASALLDVEKRPTMTYRSPRVSDAGEDRTVEGELTIGGEPRPVTLAVESGGLVRRADGRQPSCRVRGDGRGPAQRVRTRIRPGLLGEVVKIQLDMQFVGPNNA